MDLLKKELERKKKAVQLAKQKAAGPRAGNSTDRTFLKAAELRRIQEDEEERLRKRKHSAFRNDTGDKQKKRRQDRSSEKDTATTKTHHPAATIDANTSARPASSTVDMPLTAIVARLRSLGLPIRLFGESESEQMNRLREALEQQEHAAAGQSEMDEFRLGSGHGIRNPFLERQGEAEHVSGTMEAVAGAQTSTKATSSSREGTRGEEHEADIDKPDGDHAQDDDGVDDASDPHKRIYRFFKSLLRQWEEDLANRSEEVKRTAAGRNETNTAKQCKDYIRPLFKLCKSRRLEPSLMSHILKIVEYCEAGEFVKAHDSYLDVAIGRAAWPIGVTMVGIHARSGRAKIESAKVAHVMNSELQRKYLTSVKRLMSYYQKKRDDVAPSKKVVN